MYLHAENERHCSNCGKLLLAVDQIQKFLHKNMKGIVCSLCASLLFAQVATAQLDFGSISKSDYPINNFFSQSVDFIFNANTSLTTSTVLISPGDHMIDFAEIYKIEHPVPFIKQEKQSGKQINDERF